MIATVVNGNVLSGGQSLRHVFNIRPGLLQMLRDAGALLRGEIWNGSQYPAKGYGDVV